MGIANALDTGRKGWMETPFRKYPCLLARLPRYVRSILERNECPVGF